MNQIKEVEAVKIYQVAQKSLLEDFKGNEDLVIKTGSRDDVRAHVEVGMEEVQGNLNDKRMREYVTGSLCELYGIK